MDHLVFIGLGNPGRRYERTPHNAGFCCVEEIFSRLRQPESEVNHHMALARGKWQDKMVTLARPLTYMNESGRAVEWFLSEYDCSPADIAVIYDDIDLPLGSVRIKPHGSPGSHRGMQSVSQHLNTTDFVRIRIGIRQPDGPAKDIVSYVLTPLEGSALSEFRYGVSRAASAALELSNTSIETVMNRYNRKNSRNAGPGDNGTDNKLLAPMQGGCRIGDSLCEAGRKNRLRFWKRLFSRKNRKEV